MVAYWVWTNQKVNSYFVDFKQIKKIFFTIENLFSHAVRDNLQDFFT